MLLSREKSGWPKRRPDPKVIAGSPAFLATKRIIFVRHGESTWNEVFNRGFNLGFPFRLFEGLLSELLPPPHQVQLLRGRAALRPSGTSRPRTFASTCEASTPRTRRPKGPSAAWRTPARSRASRARASSSRPT